MSEVAKMEWEDAEGEAEGKDIIARLAGEPHDVAHGELYDASEDVSAAA